jgi:hypothetical protein
VRADLEGAIFNYAKLTGVNFANAALKNASFLGATTNDVNLTATDWWLARGWSLSQVDKFVKQFPPAEFTSSPVFGNRKKGDQRLIDLAERSSDSFQERLALNSWAWDMAICDQEISAAESRARRALRLSQTLPMDDFTNLVKDQITDTLAYVLMIEGNWDEAKSLEGGLLTAGHDPTLTPEWKYRYALILFHQGNKEAAAKYLYQSTAAGYFPSHELVVFRPLPQQLAATLATPK